MRRILSVLGVTAVVFAVPVLAAQVDPAKVDPAKVDPAKVEAGAYTIEPAHTQVMFGVNHLGFTTYFGSFTDTTGTLNLDPGKPDQSTLDVRVKVASVAVQSAKLQDELKGDQWLDAAKYPDMEFKSTKVMTTGSTTANVMGDLTIHGVTKPVTLVVSFVGAGPNPISKAYTAGFEAKGKIKRSDFGVKTYVPMIGDDVDLIISGAFEHQG